MPLKPSASLVSLCHMLLLSKETQNFSPFEKLGDIYESACTLLQWIGFMRPAIIRVNFIILSDVARCNGQGRMSASASAGKVKKIPYTGVDTTKRQVQKFRSVRYAARLGT